MEDTIKLKKCPFCGLDAAYILRQECLKNGFVSYALTHSLTACILDGWMCQQAFRSEEEAAEEWNAWKAD